MELFNLNDTQTPAKRVAVQVLRSAENQAKQIAIGYKNNYEKIWKNSDVNPIDVISELGTNAAKLFYITNQTMALASPDELKPLPDGYTWQPMPDGSITLTYTAPQEPTIPSSSSGTDTGGPTTVGI